MRQSSASILFLFLTFINTIPEKLFHRIKQTRMKDFVSSGVIRLFKCLLRFMAKIRENISRITLNNLLFGKRFSSSSVRLKVRIRKFFCPVSTVIHFLKSYSNISVGLLFDFCCAGSLLQGEAFSSYAWA